MVWLLRLRRNRWDRATTNLKTSVLHAAQHALYKTDPIRADARVRRSQRRRLRLGAARPARPTWIGDRFQRTSARTAAVNGLEDLMLVWPRLWSVLPDSLRADITNARDAYTASARLAAWGLLYGVVAVIWWPAAFIGITVLTTAVLRARDTADVLASLIETAADLHATDLAVRLRIPATAVAAQTGREITARLRTAQQGTAGPPPPG